MRRNESVIPGMVAQPVSIDSGDSIGDEISWGAGGDSYYEVSHGGPKPRLTVVSVESVLAMAK